VLADIATAVVDVSKPPWSYLWDIAAARYRDRLPPIDLLIDTCGSPRAAAIAGDELPCEYVRVGSVPIFSRLGFAAEQLYARTAAMLSLDEPYQPPVLVPSGVAIALYKDDFNWHSNKGPAVVIHPGGSHAGKTWPLANWLNLADLLRKTVEARIVWVFGVQDEERGLILPQRNGEMVYVPRDIAAVAGLACAADVYCGSEGGPSHVAAWSMRPDCTRPRCVLPWRRFSRPAWAPPLDTATVLDMDAPKYDHPTVPEMLDAVAAQLEAARKA